MTAGMPRDTRGDNGEVKMGKRFSYGMVGGGPGALIGEIHRRGISMTERADLVAGCFSRNAEKNRRAAQELQIAEDRVYGDYKEMAAAESARADGIDFVCIVTANATHYEIAKEFLMHGIHVACDKPLCFTSAQAQELADIAKEKGLMFAVTYTYSACDATILARELVRKGEIGEVMNVNATYFQGWMLDVMYGTEEESDIPVWRTQPSQSGISNCVGDIGSHIENTVSRITGFHPARVAAVLDKYGQPLDTNANILVEYANGVHGVYSSSQVFTGERCDLEVSVFGTEGTLEWTWREADRLSVTKRGQGTRHYFAPHAGDPDAADTKHARAFANIYAPFMDAIEKTQSGVITDLASADFPTVVDGTAGVKFIEAVVRSDAAHAAWEEV